MPIDARHAQIEPAAQVLKRQGRLFRREINAREGRTVPGFALDVMQRLASYDWPGNVRELENFVERAVVIARTRTIVNNDLPTHIGHAGAPVVDLSMRGVDLRGLLAEIEERLGAQARRRRNVA